MDRRSFLRGLLTVAGAATVTAVLPAHAALALPRIVGDGIHDDTDALQAALDGQPFVADNVVLSDAQVLQFQDGIFRTTRPLIISSVEGVDMDGNCRARILADHHDDVIRVCAGSRMAVRNFRFDRARNDLGEGDQSTVFRYSFDMSVSEPERV